MRTEKLYYKDSYIKEFDAIVLSCEKQDNGVFALELDATAFFPEGGGQTSDTGVIGNVNVLDVQEKDNRILHYVDKEIGVGENVHCTLDFETRFRKMQNHSGEHMVSGTVHRMFGLDNVGFHMGKDDITIDYNGFLDRESILRIEREANRTVYANVPITADFPSKEELAKINYRSKKELDGDIRIVTVKDCDVCACCAPHVNRTGEVGIIKLLDAIKYKGGVRIHMLCGFDALEDYNKKYESVRYIANELSAKQDELREVFDKFSNDFASFRAEFSKLKSDFLAEKLKSIPFTEGNLCLFEKDIAPDALRRFCSDAADKCTGICAVFSGDEMSYNYVIISRSTDLSALRGEINSAISGRGGGSSEMLQGKASCTAEQAKAYFLK